jgi:uncharacterized protein (TIGR02145 family)
MKTPILTIVKQKIGLFIYPLLVMGIIVILAISCKKDEPPAIIPATTVTDIEGNVYKIVTIGTQTWMAENLTVTKLNDGTSMTSELFDIKTPGYCIPDGGYGYGALYNWYAINSGKLCPVGWHVPNDEEWTTLINYAGGTQTGGDKLKESGATHWGSPNINATNETGFTALPAGERSSDGYLFPSVGEGVWWSSTETDNLRAPIWYIYSDVPVVSTGPVGKKADASVRCLKN